MRFKSRHSELQNDWIEPEYSHGHGSSQNPYSHETASQHNGDWKLPPSDMPESDWQAPLPPRLTEPAFSSNWPPAPPPSTWHEPHSLLPTIPLPLPSHPAIPARPLPIPQAPYPPARNDFFEYWSPHPTGLELSPMKHDPTPPIPRRFSAEPTFARPLGKGHPILPDVAPARGPARGPASRQQNKVRFSNHHVRKGRSALVRRFFEADDEEEPVGDGAPTSPSGLPPALRRAPEVLFSELISSRVYSCQRLNYPPNPSFRPLNPLHFPPHSHILPLHAQIPQRKDREVSFSHRFRLFPSRYET
jgi:hypothetical protein